MTNNVLFAITHPIVSLRVKERQISVACDFGMAPEGSSQEDFPELSLSEAAGLLGLVHQKAEGGVPLSAYSPADQVRMKNGQRPLSHPEHPNV